MAGRVLGTVVHTRDADELRDVALRVLSDRFAAEQRIEVSKDEVEAYVRRVRAAMAQDLASTRARRDDLAARVATAPPGAERERVQRELEPARQRRRGAGVREATLAGGAGDCVTALSGSPAPRLATGAAVERPAAAAGCAEQATAGLRMRDPDSRALADLIHCRASAPGVATARLLKKS